MAKLARNVKFGVGHQTTDTLPDYYFYLRDGFTANDIAPKVILQENDSDGFQGSTAAIIGNRYIDGATIPMYLRIEYVYKTLASCLGRATPTAQTVSGKNSYTITPDPNRSIQNYAIFYEDSGAAGANIVKKSIGGTRAVSVGFGTDNALTYDVTFDGESVEELGSPATLTTAYLANSIPLAPNDVTKFAYTPSGGSETDIKSLITSATIAISSGTALEAKADGSRKRVPSGDFTTEITFTRQRDNDAFSDLLASKDACAFDLSVVNGNFTFRIQMTGIQTTGVDIARGFGSQVQESITFVGTGHGNMPLTATIEVPDSITIT